MVICEVMITDVPEIEGFEFKKRLAQSARCTLWRAVQRTLERDVLVVVFLPEVVENRALGDVLFGVMRVLTQLKSSFIPDVIDMIRTPNEAYVILEDRHAKKLLELLDGERITPEKLIEVAIKLAEGFAALRAVHLVYGGLKPSKVFISEDSDPILLDISPIAFEAGFGENPPLDALVGSAPYVAPEQYLFPERVDSRADMFALGMTLYALATGQVPFGAFSPEETLDLKLSRKIPSPCDLVPGFPRGLSLVLTKLSQRVASDRYADWDEVLFDLHEVRRGNAPGNITGEDSVIALPTPKPHAHAERTIRLQASKLQTYRRMRFSRKRPPLWMLIAWGVIGTLFMAGILLIFIGLFFV